MNTDEQQIISLLQEKHLQVRRFTKKEKKKSKAPDFRIFKKDKLVFFCEVKTIARDEWLEKQVLESHPGEIVGGARSDPRFNRLSNKIHDAMQQFEAVNPNSEYPNVLAFVNHDDTCGWLDLIAVTTGQFLAEGGGLHGIYGKYSEGRIKEEKFQIHLYIWIDEFKGDLYLFNQVEKKHLNNLCSYFGKDPRDIENILNLHQQQKL